MLYLLFFLRLLTCLCGKNILTKTEISTTIRSQKLTNREKNVLSLILMREQLKRVIEMGNKLSLRSKLWIDDFNDFVDKIEEI